MVNIAIMTPPSMPVMAPAIRKPRSRFWFLVVSIYISSFRVHPFCVERVTFVEPPAQSVLPEV